MSNYSGRGGFPIDSILMRLAAAVSMSEYNILFTGLTTTRAA